MTEISIGALRDMASNNRDELDRGVDPSAMKEIGFVDLLDTHVEGARIRQIGQTAAERLCDCIAIADKPELISDEPASAAVITNESIAEIIDRTRRGLGGAAPRPSSRSEAWLTPTYVHGREGPHHRS